MQLKTPPIVKLNITDSSYPERLIRVLGKSAPKELYLIGNRELLNDSGIGFCGSRNVSSKGLETAKDCTVQAVDEGIIIVSGNAAGVDHEVHYNALKSGGKTIFVLPEGIEHFKVKKSLEDVWDWERVLVISQFSPSEPWAIYRAMSRNLVIIGLSRAMIVIEANDTGGTLNAGQETLKAGLPLYVAEYQDMSSDAKGNKILLAMGAKRLAKSKTTNKANLQGAFEAIKQDSLISSSFVQHSLI